MSKTILLLLIMLVTVSCGEKKGTSSVKLKIFQSSITSNIEMTGGILLMGRSEDGLNSFRTSISSTSDTLAMDLAKGRWEFAAVAWMNTSGPMSGDNRCGYTGFVDLKDTEVNVTFNMSQDRCRSDFNGNQFSDPNHVTSTGKFLEFFPVMCNVNTPGDAGCYYTSNPTSIGSYKVTYNPESKGLATGSFTALNSNCLGISTAPRVRIPVTSDQGSSPLKVSVAFFANATCNGTPVINHTFNNGIANNQLPLWNATTISSNYYSYLYINPGMQYDLAVVNPTGFSLYSGAILSGGNPAYPTNAIIYNLPNPLPANVTDVCFTLESTCPAGKWIPVSLLTGNLVVDGAVADGSYSLKLFYKTLAQVVSTAFTETQFVVDATPPVMPIVNLPTATVTNGIDVTWSSSDQSMFAYWKVYVCSDASCSNILGNKQVNDFSNKFANIGIAELGFTPILGTNYCIMVKAYDLFSRGSASAPVCVTTNP